MEKAAGASGDDEGGLGCRQAASKRKQGQGAGAGCGVGQWRVAVMESDGGDGACDGGTGDGRGTSVAHRESGSNEQVGSESRGSRWLRYAPSEARAFSALLSKIHRQIPNARVP